MTDYFRISPLYSPVGRVDREANIIYGCKIIDAGRVNDDRPFLIDSGTLQQVLNHAEDHANGLKCRFTHPNICSDGLGRYLGRWKNFRQNGNAIYADLHLAETSFNTPHGDLGGYVLDMAEEDPEAFGVSIAAVLADEMRAALETLGDDSPEAIPYRLKALQAADVVGDPAATRGGLFSIDSISDRRDIPHFVAQFLGTYFADADPKAVASQALRMISHHYGVPVALDTSPAPESHLENVQTYVGTFGEQGYIYYGKGMTLAQCHEAELAVKRQQIEALEAQIRLMDAETESLRSEFEEARSRFQVRLDAALAASGAL
ncbi:hypothetical protein [Blastopirellula marina]|uniref:Uncharacterized protein n=1 Tax=Blastopirellula marina TaxID=124 RepID=A0A2S8GQL5_9BACT|nr:hypothetical protein [Blastopirellula marina]PQO46723.1 hypothetical protein C5Y93_07770 [Blastopirellula marina]